MEATALRLVACRAQAARRLRTQLVVAGLIVGSCGFAAAADDVAAGVDSADLHFSGFGTIGLVHGNTTDGAGFRRDVFERSNRGGLRGDIDTRLGVQANYRASQEIELVGQVVAANRLANAPPSDFLTLAFAAWQPSDDITLRAGRMSADYFLLADYRHVGFAYPFVRPPVEGYGSLPYELDGADLTKAWNDDERVWKLRGIAGQSRFLTEQGDGPVWLRPVLALVLSRDDGNGLLVKASAVRTRLRIQGAAVAPMLGALGQIASLPIASVAADAADIAAAINIDSRPVTYYSLSASLDRASWLCSLEVSRAQQTGSSYSSAWGLVGHRWGAVTGYAGLSAIRTDQRLSPPQWTAALTPLLGAPAAAQAQRLGLISFSAAATTRANQRTLTVGMRWDLSDRVALKLQFDRVRVDAYSGRLWSGTGATEAINAEIGSVAVDFVF